MFFYYIAVNSQLSVWKHYIQFAFKYFLLDYIPSVISTILKTNMI